jgi:pimeloyl-ACP methyl ester carboxylesterase
MDASAFEPVADLLAGSHRVITADPRGINRSPVDDPDADSTPQLRADDLHRLLRHLDSGPAAVLGSSGGASTALALAQLHPEWVHTVIAHEPPVVELLDDREEHHRATEEVIATYLAGDTAGAWRRYLADAGISLPEPVFDAMFGRERSSKEAADERFAFTRMERATNLWRPDIRALLEADVRIVIGIGEQSSGQLCDRTSRALATALGVGPVAFPGGHVGFVEQPEQFAHRLRAVLAAGG